MKIKKTGRHSYEVNMTIDEREYIYDAILSALGNAGGDLKIATPAQKGEPYEIIISPTKPLTI